MSEPQNPGSDRPPPTPRWVKIAGAAAVLLLVALLVGALLGDGAGGHGPGRHGSLGPSAAAPALAHARTLPGQ